MINSSDPSTLQSKGRGLSSSSRATGGSDITRSSGNHVDLVYTMPSMADDPALPPPAAPPDADAPDRPHVGIREARPRLGELADQARYLDQVTYLTKHGRAVAAVVPADAARTRAQLAALTQQTHAERDAERARYQRLDRAAAATLDPVEVLWARAYRQVWETLDEVAKNFHWRVEEIVERELAAERSGAYHNNGQDDEDDWGDDSGGRDFDFLKNVTALRDAERQRRELADAITQHAAELEAADARHPDRSPALDWLGWARRIEHLTGLVAAARPHVADARTAAATAFARRRLADALAETATLLRELDTLPDHLTTPPADGLERRIWDAAIHHGLPLITTLTELGGPGRFTDATTRAEYARHELVQLHRDGKVKLYRYLGGRPHEVNPAQIIPEARFHLAPIADPPDGWTPDRPIIVTG